MTLDVDSLIEPLIEPLTQATILERHFQSSVVRPNLTDGSKRPTEATLDAPNKREKWNDCCSLVSNDGTTFTSQGSVYSRRARRVRFAPDARLAQIVCRVPHRSAWTDHERHWLFWTLVDLKHIRDAAKHIAKYYRSSSPSSQSSTQCREDQSTQSQQQSNCQRALQALDHVYETSFTARPHDDESSDLYESSSWQQFLYNETNQMDRFAAPLVVHWCRSDASLDGDGDMAASLPLARGLERYCSVRQRTERSEWTYRCRQAVLQLDRRHRHCGRGHHIDEQADAVAQLSRDYSRSAVVFARLMGHADELAAEQASFLEPRLVPVHSAPYTVHSAHATVLRANVPVPEGPPHHARHAPHQAVPIHDGFHTGSHSNMTRPPAPILIPLPWSQATPCPTNASMDQRTAKCWPHGTVSTDWYPVLNPPHVSSSSATRVGLDCAPKPNRVVAHAS